MHRRVALCTDSRQNLWQECGVWYRQAIPGAESELQSTSRDTPKLARDAPMRPGLNGGQLCRQGSRAQRSGSPSAESSSFLDRRLFPPPFRPLVHRNPRALAPNQAQFLLWQHELNPIHIFTQFPPMGPAPPVGAPPPMASAPTMGSPCLDGIIPMCRGQPERTEGPAMRSVSPSLAGVKMQTCGPSRATPQTDVPRKPACNLGGASGAPKNSENFP